MMRQYVEKPAKVQAEQYLAAAQPPAAGVCTEPHPPFLDGQPHVHVAGAGPTAVHETDMIVWDHYQPDIIRDVQPLAEFEDRYGQVAGPAEGG